LANIFAWCWARWALTAAQALLEPLTPLMVLMVISFLGKWVKCHPEPKEPSDSLILESGGIAGLSALYRA
jgi:hypothetical protein